MLLVSLSILSFTFMTWAESLAHSELLASFRAVACNTLLPSLSCEACQETSGMALLVHQDLPIITCVHLSSDVFT